MKKIFALALAALMTAGMTTVAFAADGLDLHNGAQQTIYYIDLDDSEVYDLDEGYTNATIANAAGDIEGGEYVAIPIAKGSQWATKDDVKGYKVYADWLINEPGEKPAIKEVVVKTASGTETRQAVVFTLPELNENKALELVGKLGVYKNSSNKTTGLEDINITVGVDAVDYDVAEGDEFNNGPVKFENGGVKINDVVNMTFGDDFEFEVDVTGQGKLNLAWNTDFNKEFGDMYEYANIDFINFEYTPSFNKNGTVYLYADEDAFIYEVTADGAKEINGLAWDEDYEAWTFKTRTLSSYAISDVELDEKTVTEDKDDASSTTDGDDKPNPDTGR